MWAGKERKGSTGRGLRPAGAGSSPGVGLQSVEIQTDFNALEVPITKGILWCGLGRKGTVNNKQQNTECT